MAKYDYLKGRIIQDTKRGHLCLITHVYPETLTFKKKLIKKGEGLYMSTWDVYRTPFALLYSKYVVLDLDNPLYLLYGDSY